MINTALIGRQAVATLIKLSDHLEFPDVEPGFAVVSTLRRSIRRLKRSFEAMGRDWDHAA